MATIAIIVAVLLGVGLLGILVVALLPTGDTPRIAANSLDQSGLIHGILGGIGG
jgi:Tfp pilus assembly protein PilX